MAVTPSAYRAVMKVRPGGAGGGSAAAPPAAGQPSVCESIATKLRGVDRLMAEVLRDWAAAAPEHGLSVRRQVALLADVTGTDVAFLDRAVQTLAAMPLTWSAFDAGRLSWSQLRGIVCEARRLSVAQRAVLDGCLTDLLDRGPGEPDRIVEVAGDVAARLDAAGQEADERAAERGQRLVVQLGFDGSSEIHGVLGPELTATVCEALDALADPPVAADAPPATDDDGRVLPAAARPPVSRSAQWAEALGRMAAIALGGSRTRARPSATVVIPIDALTSHSPDGIASMTARLLPPRGSGRRRISRLLACTLADDADLVALFIDGDGMPVAIGDSTSPITTPQRRAVAARDQGCRAPGCSAPMAFCDIHHVIPREHGGSTEVINLAAMCRACHTRLRLHRWRMRMDADGTLHTRIGRHDYTTRPRLLQRPAA
jgi:hypothetical protein